jgi:Ran GTPase-activating protein (RanGAP) involved in mRNA processing and transport
MDNSICINTTLGFFEASVVSIHLSMSQNSIMHDNPTNDVIHEIDDIVSSENNFTSNVSSTWSMGTNIYEMHNIIGTKLKMMLQQHNNTMVRLTLSHFLLNHEIATEISKGICNNKTLQELQIVNCKIDDVSILALTVPFLSVELLNLSGTNISSKSAATLGSIICSPNCALTTLDLGECKMCNVAVSIIGNALIYNTSLTSVNLNGNNISVETSKSIARAMLYSPCLQELYLKGCLIGDEGAAWIASGLSYNRTLVNLVLSQNQITNIGIKSISKNITYHPTLRTLDLRSNDYSTATGIIQLLEDVAKNRVLLELYLPECSYENLVEIRVKIEKLLAYNYTLQVLTDLEDHKRGDSDDELDFQQLLNARLEFANNRRKTTTSSNF